MAQTISQSFTNVISRSDKYRLSTGKLDKTWLYHIGYQLRDNRLQYTTERQSSPRHNWETIISNTQLRDNHLQYTTEKQSSPIHNWETIISNTQLTIISNTQLTIISNTQLRDNHLQYTTETINSSKQLLILWQYSYSQWTADNKAVHGLLPAIKLFTAGCRQ